VCIYCSRIALNSYRGGTEGQKDGGRTGGVRERGERGRGEREGGRGEREGREGGQEGEGRDRWRERITTCKCPSAAYPQSSCSNASLTHVQQHYHTPIHAPYLLSSSIKNVQYGYLIINDTLLPI